MTTATVVHTGVASSEEAGASLGSRIHQAFGGERPDALILFASPRYDFSKLLLAIDMECRPRTLVGTSSAGEFTGQAQGVGLACAMAIRAPEMRFHASLGRALSRDPRKAASEMIATFHGIGNPSFAYRTALVFADAMAGQSDRFALHLSTLTGGSYRFVGGGAGDERFEDRVVFHGTEVVADAAVALEILSNKPIGVGVTHGWSPRSGAFRVTEAEGLRLASLNAIAAADVFEDHAERTGQKMDRQDAFPFFLHNILGVDTGPGPKKLRVPLRVQDDGAVSCAAEIPEGATVRIMGCTTATAAEAAVQSTKEAMRQLEGHKPALAIFFDCVATRLRMGHDFGIELDSIRNELGEAKLLGCNTIGQIVSAEGQFSGFHNCTAVTCLIPE
ncbi:FIST signal transduction protein [Pendulispora albinea]|uniref:FIST C-terminal domain-containing protein n=1 Tax=Pendulispora albinea TaxID=2741071 RepID=A0ABZ2LMC8_9BACT